MSRSLIVIILFAGFIQACSRSDKIITDYKYESGQKFTYLVHNLLVHENGDTLYNDEETVVLEVMSTNATVGIWSNLIEFKVYDQNTPNFYSTYWYQQTRDALYDIAYRRPGFTPIVQPKESPYLTGDPKSAVLPSYSGESSFKSSSDDSIVIRDDIRLVSPIPLYRKRNLRWTEFTDPFLRTSKVISDSTLIVNGKEFLTYNILSELPELDDDLEVHTYMSENGLIYRTLFDKTLYFDPESSVESGNAITKQTISLIDFRID